MENNDGAFCLFFSPYADAGAALDPDTQHPRCQTSPDWKLPGTSVCECVRENIYLDK